MPPNLRLRRQVSPLTVLAAGLVGLAPALIPATAPAASKQCQPVVIATGGHPQSELEARKAAVLQWIAAAKVYGEGFTRWQLAHQRSLTCQQVATGGHLCRAIARPCVITQNPEQPLPQPDPLPKPSRKPLDV